LVRPKVMMMYLSATPWVENHQDCSQSWVWFDDSPISNQRWNITYPKRRYYLASTRTS
jgi:hypothetical protein